MPKAIRIHETGGPDVMRWEDVEVGPPAKGEVLLRHTAIGVNYIDTYHRSGLYPLPLPAILGSEGAGIIEEVGMDVTDLKQGDRVAYGCAPPGAYAEKRVIEAKLLVKIPAFLSDLQAAAVMLKGLTAWYLLRKTYCVSKGETILFHAAAGGVGLLFGQWAKFLGVNVIGTAGDEKKAEIARAHGFDKVILYRTTNFVDEIKKLTDQKGLPVVYDGVGKDTFLGSLDCLAPCGLMVSFGNASGAVPPFNLGLLTQKGSLYLTRPSLAHYVSKPGQLQEGATELFGLLEKGVIKIAVNQTYALKDAANAHRCLEARHHSGSTILQP